MTKRETLQEREKKIIWRHCYNVCMLIIHNFFYDGSTQDTLYLTDPRPGPFSGVQTEKSLPRLTSSENSRIEDSEVILTLCRKYRVVGRTSYSGGPLSTSLGECGLMTCHRVRRTDQQTSSFFYSGLHVFVEDQLP